MTITSAFNSAMSGLTATSRGSQVVAENLSNALTPGYTRRTLNLSTEAYMPGVRVGSVERMVDPGVLSARRGAESELAVANIHANFFSRMSDLVGIVDDETSITAQMSNFENALVEAISRPDSTGRLHDLSVKADVLVQSITDAAHGLNDMRIEADTNIGVQVERLNNALKEIEKLNARIVVAEAGGMDAATMHDQRSLLVDQVNEMIPVKIVQRDQGRIALFSTGGVTLIDGKAAEVSFSPKGDMLPHMTIDNGLLSGLEIDGRPIGTDPATSTVRGGTLIAQFDIRDVKAVEAQEDLDAMTVDLIERFQDPALDATIGATDAGIFTDEGGFFDPANTIGISGRLELHDSVAMDGAAETWRFRDGLYAAAPGDPGDASLLHGYSDALEAARPVSSIGLGTMNASASDISATLMGRFARDDNAATQLKTFASAGLTAMAQAEAGMGVDTDAELQNLMILERSYAANAKMLTTIDEMIETILRM